MIGSRLHGRPWFSCRLCWHSDSGRAVQMSSDDRPGLLRSLADPQQVGGGRRDVHRGTGESCFSSVSRRLSSFSRNEYGV